MNIWEILGIATIPALIVSILITVLINRAFKKIEQREEARKKEEYLVVKGVLASLSLAEAQAKELKKEGHVNGETTEALQYANKTKGEIKDFFIQQGIDNIQ